MRKWLIVFISLIVLNSCQYKEVEREVGYKGKARINPWLALERFVVQSGRDAHSVISWTAPESKDAVWVMPAAILSNESYTRRMVNWVDNGGHLLLLVEHADSETGDWSNYAMPPDLKPSLFSMLSRLGLELNEQGGCEKRASTKLIVFEEKEFKVNVESKITIAVEGEDAGVFASRTYGDGRITVITDGRVFRNRWIGEHNHADLLQALIDSTQNDGRVGIMRGSGLSFSGLVMDYLPELLFGIAVWLLLWLWKSLSRFGPMEPATTPPILRGFEHHLDSLGDFQWRLDHGAALLTPLREQIIEIGHRTRARVGRGEDDFFQFLADRGELTRERVSRALTEARPADATVLTTITADLQQLFKVLNSNTPS